VSEDKEPQDLMADVSLLELGWSNFFIQQLSLDEWDEVIPVRIIAHHRTELMVASDQGRFGVALPANFEGQVTVGDWLLLDSQKQLSRVLERSSVFSRKAPGGKHRTQLIAANVDTLFIVCSMNQDFNLNRIERYLVLANEAQAEAVLVLTKADLCESPEVVDGFIAQIQSLNPYLMVIAVNALHTTALGQFSPWCKKGKTLALLGSSGVGKSTLANLLTGDTSLLTAGIREGDSKGRHTTTSRSLHLIPAGEILSGGILLDTPGMRELQLANMEDGIEETFADIMAFADHCRFFDCSHEANLSESSGCAVQAAIINGELEERRVISFQKLQREDQLNSASLAERRDKDKKLGKMIRSVQNEAKNRKKK
jgi:ribosome biogenesis GTPase